MIAGHFHQGSGLGNQLFRYITTRVLALDNGYEFGMNNPELFKGSHFMQLDMGVPVEGINKEFHEKRVNHPDGSDIRDYDPEILNVEDGTVIEGEFQSEKYWSHRKDEIREWLKVETKEMPDDLCIINFRGGEYVQFPELFLPKGYWDAGLAYMRKINPNMKFEVHTDDPLTAREFFPGFHIIHDMEQNWRSIRYAKYLLLSNSSFAIIPAILNQDVKHIVAPWGWARRNRGYWGLPSNEYSGWTYL